MKSHVANLQGEAARLEIAWVIRRQGAQDELRWTLQPQAAGGALQATWASAARHPLQPASTPARLTLLHSGLWHIDVPGLLIAALRVGLAEPELLYAISTLLPIADATVACIERPVLCASGNWRALLGAPVVRERISGEAQRLTAAP